MLVFLNGKIVPAEQASLRIEDAGFQHAVGLFETMSATQGRVFRLRQHLARLAASATSLGLARQVAIDPLVAAVEQTLQANNLTQARIRLTLTAGPISFLKPPQPGQAEPLPTLLIVATPPTVYAPEFFTQGVMALIAPAGANPFDPLAGHKTLSYWARLRTLRQAAAAGAHEAIWLNITNHLASGSISNVFLAKNEILYTPFARDEEVPGSLPAPVLPGITRQAVLELAAAQGIACERKMLAISDLLEADEVFLTNSSWNILPVTKIEKSPIRQGEVGPITQTLRQSLLDLMEKETMEDGQGPSA